jgi:hypothetical protein
LTDWVDVATVFIQSVCCLEFVLKKQPGVEPTLVFNTCLPQLLPVKVRIRACKLSFICRLCGVFTISRESPTDVIWLVSKLHLIDQTPELNQLVDHILRVDPLQSIHPSPGSASLGHRYIFALGLSI